MAGKCETKRAQFGRDSKGHHEVGNREQPCLLPGAPELLVERAALRAVAVVAAMVGEVVLRASIALVEPTAQLGSAARENAPHRPVVCRAEPGAVGRGVALPMLPQKVGETQRHDEWGSVVVSGSGECAQGNTGFFLADFGEMEIDHDRLERAVPEVGGHLPDGSTAFEHVSGVAMPQGMNPEDLVFFIKTTLNLSEINSGPASRLTHVFGMRAERLSQRESLLLPGTPDAREKPFGVTVGLPERPEALIEFRRNGDFPGLAPFAIDDTNDEPLPVDVFWFDPKRFAQSQPALVDDSEVGPIATFAKRAQKKGYFLA